MAKTTGHLPDAMPDTAPAPGARPARRRPAVAAPPPTSPAGPDSASPAATWRASLREFAALADRNWDDGRDGLYGGRLAAWLRDLGDRNAAADATAIASSEPTPDVGLETFLERVVPGLAPATLEVAPCNWPRAAARRRAQPADAPDP